LKRSSRKRRKGKVEESQDIQRKGTFLAPETQKLRKRVVKALAMTLKTKMIKIIGNIPPKSILLKDLQKSQTIRNSRKRGNKTLRKPGNPAMSLQISFICSSRIWIKKNYNTMAVLSISSTWLYLLK